MSNRIEAKMTIPTGGAAMTAGNSGGAAATATVPAGSYYLTPAGSVSGLLSTMQTQLNASRPTQGYPATAAEMAKVVGYGTWTYGWKFDMASGNASPLFGGVTLTASGALGYQQPGARPSGVPNNYAVKFDATGNSLLFAANTNMDISATEDAAWLWVGKFSSSITPSGFLRLAVKSPFTGGVGYWHAYMQGTANGSRFVMEIADAAANAAQAAINSAIIYDQWCVILAALDRGTSKLRIGVHYLSTGQQFISTEVSTSAVGSLTNTATGAAVGAFADSPGWYCAAAYQLEGVGAASGMSANMSTALSNFARSVNGGWSAALDLTTGKVTIGCSDAIGASSPSFSLAWSGSTLRDNLGFSRDLDYPATASELTAQVGYGDWSGAAAYRCDEASGNLSSVFGSPASLIASGSLTYGIAGPRGGSDKAIRIVSGNNGFAGGAVHDVTAPKDLMLLWVGKYNGNSTSAATIFSKVSGAFADGWAVTSNSTTNIIAQLRQTSGTLRNSTVSNRFVGEWHVGLFVIDRAANVIRLGLQSLATGTQSLGTTDTPGGESYTTAANFNVGTSAWTFLAEPNIDIAHFAITTGIGVANGVGANFSAALSAYAATFGSWTGTSSAHGVWIPEAPFDLKGDAYQAPRASDKRDQETPGGQVLSLVGNWKYRHRGVIYTAIPNTRAWEAYAPYANASWESFCKETQLGLGSSWFPPGSQVQIYYPNAAGVDVRVGQAANGGAGLNGWTIKGVDSVDLKNTQASYTGLFNLELPELVSNG